MPRPEGQFRIGTGDQDSRAAFGQPRELGRRPFEQVVGLGKRHVLVVERVEQSGDDRYVENYVGGARRTQRLDFRATARLGGIAYSFVGVEATEFRPFSHAYTSEDIPSIKTILDNLIDLKPDGTFRLNMDYFDYQVVFYILYIPAKESSSILRA